MRFRVEEPSSARFENSAHVTAETLEADPNRALLGTSVCTPAQPAGGRPGWPGSVGPGAQADRLCPALQYQVEPAQLVTRRLQVSVWHLGALARRVFLGEVIIPLATWDFKDSTTQSFRWYPLRAKVMSGLDGATPPPP